MNICQFNVEVSVRNTEYQTEIVCNKYKIEECIAIVKQLTMRKSFEYAWEMHGRTSGTTMPRLLLQGYTNYFVNIDSPPAFKITNTVKPVCNDHLYDKINYLWFIQECVLMKNEGINLLLLTMSASWSSCKWPLAT